VLVCGTAISRAADDAIAKGKDPAADLLELAAQDLEYGEGRYTIVGSDRAVTLFEVAAAMRDDTAEEPGALTGAGEFTPGEPNFPNGCHVCEVEIDRDTGAVDIVNYVVVDDFGRVINPLLLAGQIHGGIAQGAGQALMEQAVYDASGQLLSASFMDYCMPRASDLPMLDTSWREILCRTNPLGMKGAGEAGTIGAPAAVINAVVDSLAEFGVTHIDMPATPERVWRAITGSHPGR
jgi:carbon-monoxide dehydrogenase large subunit